MRRQARVCASLALVAALAACGDDLPTYDATDTTAGLNYMRHNAPEWVASSLCPYASDLDGALDFLRDDQQGHFDRDAVAAFMAEHCD